MTEAARPANVAWIDLTVVDGPRPVSGQRFCAIRDTAGAVAGFVGP